MILFRLQSILSLPNACKVKQYEYTGVSVKLGIGKEGAHVSVNIFAGRRTGFRFGMMIKRTQRQGRWARFCIVSTTGFRFDYDKSKERKGFVAQLVFDFEKLHCNQLAFY